VNRNLSLLKGITDTEFIRPKLYPSPADFQKVFIQDEYVCIAPASIWFTKQFPVKKWCELINKISSKYKIYLIGHSNDRPLCEEIQKNANSDRVNNWAGKLSFLESAALIKNAKMTFANDSAPLHFASAVNAPVTAVFCSTIPQFGFGPLSDISHIIQIDYALECRPCGIHGFKKCPKKHFKCSDININSLLKEVNINDH
jgi:heptosyltransferase-2